MIGFAGNEADSDLEQVIGPDCCGDNTSLPNLYSLESPRALVKNIDCCYKLIGIN